MNASCILVPVDLSDCSVHVVEESASIAKQFGAALTLLYVVDVPVELPTDAQFSPHDGPETTIEHYLHQAAAEKMSLYELPLRRAGVQASMSVRNGPVVEVILGVAQEREADMIVMGTHGRGGLARVMLGSVAEGVLRRATCPVLTIRSQPTEECGTKTCAWCAHGGLEEQREAMVELDG